MEIIAPTKVTFSGNEDLAKRFAAEAMQTLQSLVYDCQFNNIPQAIRRKDYSAGFVIEVGINYGQRYAHVHLTSEAFEEMQKQTQEMTADFLVITITIVAVDVDPTYGNGSTYNKFVVKWQGGIVPFTAQVKAKTTTKTITNVDTALKNVSASRSIEVKRVTDTDPWGAVDGSAVGTPQQDEVGVVVIDALGKEVFAPFSGFTNKLKTFEQYGPPAVKDFPITFADKTATAFNWTGGISQFTAVLEGVAFSTGNVQLSYTNNRKRNGSLVKTSGTYWAAIDINRSTVGVRVKVTDSLGTVQYLSLSEMLGSKPAYQAPQIVSASNVNGVPTLNFRYGISQMYANLTGGLFNVALSAISGTYDGFVVTMVKADPAKDWCYYDGNAAVVISDDISSAVVQAVSGTYGPPAYVPMNITSRTNSGTTATASWSGGVAPFTASFSGGAGGLSGISLSGNTASFSEVIQNTSYGWLRWGGSGSLVITDAIGATLSIAFIPGTFGPPLYREYTANAQTSCLFKGVNPTTGTSYREQGPSGSRRFAGGYLGYPVLWSDLNTCAINGRTYYFAYFDLYYFSTTDNTSFVGGGGLELTYYNADTGAGLTVDSFSGMTGDAASGAPRGVFKVYIYKVV